ncbi:hypothetical protein [Liquorilactobacillus hordei]|uniref:hypothetical protein n=1 Tax=Liquorilactobacillus hordei TaxID=468911 RepID=UPI0039E8F9CA
MGIDELKVIYTTAPEMPYERESYSIIRVSLSQNQDLLLEVKNGEGLLQTIVVKLSNKYDFRMLFTSLYNQIGVSEEVDGNMVGKIDFSMLTGMRAIFTFQTFNFDNGNSYRNVKDILLTDQLLYSCEHDKKDGE